MPALRARALSVCPWFQYRLWHSPAIESIGRVCCVARQALDVTVHCRSCESRGGVAAWSRSFCNDEQSRPSGGAGKYRALPRVAFPSTLPRTAYPCLPYLNLTINVHHCNQSAPDTIAHWFSRFTRIQDP